VRVDEARNKDVSRQRYVRSRSVVRLDRGGWRERHDSPFIHDKRVIDERSRRLNGNDIARVDDEID